MAGGEDGGAFGSAGGEELGPRGGVEEAVDGGEGAEADAFGGEVQTGLLDGVRFGGAGGVEMRAVGGFEEEVGDEVDIIGVGDGGALVHQSDRQRRHVVLLVILGS